MNTLGKICMGLLMVCLLFATYLSVGVLKARSSWLQKIEATTAKIEAAEASVQKAEKDSAEARDLLHRENIVWGSAWVAPNSGPAPAGDGSIELGIGTDAGLGRTQKDGKLPIVYVFGTENGKSVYMGDFQLTEVRQGSAGAKLTRPPYANEMSQWPKGEYLVRANILSNYLGTIGSLHTSVLVAEQAMNHEAAILKRLDKAVMKSQAALALRESELNGKPDAPETAGSDVKDGLVKALIDEEIIRNQIVDQVDDLRRDLSDKHLKLTTILAENETSVPKLARAAASKVAAEPVAVKKTAAAKKAGTVK